MAGKREKERERQGCGKKEKKNFEVVDKTANFLLYCVPFTGLHYSF